jgi:hypothetical protein
MQEPKPAIEYNLFMGHPLLVMWLMSSNITAFPCTCVGSANAPVKTRMADDAVVFRGVVMERKTLPRRAEMRGRNRYAITFRVDEYWKGTPGRTLVIYALDNSTDCMRDGGYQVGKSYLVFAYEQPAKDFLVGDYFWHGWKDILPEGSPMLLPDIACKPGGEVGKVRAVLDQLGPGKAPPEEASR